MAIRVTLPFTVPRQLRSIEGWMPSSVATWVSGRPLPASSDTASRLNSSVNDRRVVASSSSGHLAPQELTRGVHSFGGGSLRCAEGIGFRCEVSHLIGWFLRERSPPIDLARGDLSGSEQPLRWSLHRALIPIRVVVDSDVIRRGATPPDLVTV